LIAATSTTTTMTMKEATPSIEGEKQHNTKQNKTNLRQF
jgi:hypothetical protein